MENNRNKYVILGSFFSNFGKKSYVYLGYKNQSEAFKEISKKLSLNPNTLKNYRDLFDPVTKNNKRKGWYQRETDIKRYGNYWNKISDLNFYEFLGIITFIINMNEVPNEISKLLDS